MTLTLPKPRLPRMTADEFLAWAVQQPDDERYELVDGEVVAMAPERTVHVRVESAVWLALRDAIKAAGLGCEALADGMTVRVDADLVYGPDALVRCGEALDDDATETSDPIIVVEVVSPSSGGRDRGAKLEGYFRLPTVRHYLIVNTKSRKVVHHRREDGDGDLIATRILAVGATLDLTPPGLTVEVASLFPA
jgi:Uma2 family endonuclease